MALDMRIITLFFPATCENLLYARNHSPITRVIFNPGDTICSHVCSHEGWQLIVEEVKTDHVLLTYIGIRD